MSKQLVYAINIVLMGQIAVANGETQEISLIPDEVQSL
jgi:hypothetical protein